MATSAQQQAFVQTYGPYAQQAGQTLGVDPNVILGQWAFESAWGTSRAAQQQGNLAGINIPGGTGQQYQTYSSPQAFTDAYTTLLQNPRYASALNTGSNVNAFTGGLASGGYYTSSPAEYAAGVTSTSQTAASIDPTLASGNQDFSSGDTLTMAPSQTDPLSYLNQDFYGGTPGPGGNPGLLDTVFTDPATGSVIQGQPLTGAGSGLPGTAGTQSVLPALGFDIADFATRAALVILAIVLIAAAAWALTRGETMRAGLVAVKDKVTA